MLLWGLNATSALPIQQEPKSTLTVEMKGEGIALELGDTTSKEKRDKIKAQLAALQELAASHMKMLQMHSPNGSGETPQKA